MNNFENFKNMTIEEMAESRLYISDDYDSWVGDFGVLRSGVEGAYAEALKKEIEWLKQEM